MVAFAIQMGSRGTAVRAYVTGCLGKGVVKATTLLFPSVLLPVLSDRVVLLCKRRTAV